VEEGLLGVYGKEVSRIGSLVTLEIAECLGAGPFGGEGLEYLTRFVKLITKSFVFCLRLVSEEPLSTAIFKPVIIRPLALGNSCPTKFRRGGYHCLPEHKSAPKSIAGISS
jgi:hypothetical protein